MNDALWTRVSMAFEDMLFWQDCVDDMERRALASVKRKRKKAGGPERAIKVEMWQDVDRCRYYVAAYEEGAK